jgi:ABC-2 type transport system ATP-binding protein
MRKHMECRVELLGVSKSYGRIRAVNNLSLAIRAGEIYGLLGPNGVGKTTTLKMIVGLLRPDSGTVTVCGANVVTERERALIHVGYMPENPIVFDNLKVIEFFRFVASLRSIPRDLFQERLERYVSLFHLGDELRKKMGKLSRGNVQKVLAVAAFLPEPDVLVMDEPMSGMDPEAQHVFKEEVKRVAGRGALLSSQAISSAWSSGSAQGLESCMRGGCLPKVRLTRLRTKRVRGLMSHLRRFT